MKKLLLFLALAAAGLQGWAEELYLVGRATPIGWKSSGRAITKMIETEENLFEWKGLLEANTSNDDGFKVCNGDDSWNGYKATEKGQDIVNGTTYDMTTDGDYKWDITETGFYTVTVDLRNGAKLTVVKESSVSFGINRSSVNPYSINYCEIGSLQALKDFGNLVNIGTNSTSMNAKLTADISDAMNFEIGWYDSNTSNKLYSGEFDGNGHTVTLGINDESKSNLALFGAAKGGANIHDLIVAGSVKGKAKVGGIVGYADGGGTITLTNVINTATIESTGSKDANAAGLVGCAVNNTVINATNCANTGNVKNSGYIEGKQQCAAFAGWTQSNGGTGDNLVKTTFTNCWNSGTISNIEDESQLYRNSDKVTATNCYYLSGNSDQGKKLDLNSNAVASGELCYNLNEELGSIKWYQSIGTDAYPVPFNTSQQVYEVVADESYTNFATEDINSTTHAVKIGTSDQLEKFSKEVNAGNNAMNAELTADITGVTSHTPIGTETCKYKGTFDGDGKSITLAINSSSDYQALVGHATGGITIQNLILKGSVTSTGSKTAGFIAEAKGGGNITITNCGNEATISGGGGETAAIVANNIGSSPCTLNLTNVYNTGDVSGSGDVSTISAFAAYSNFKNVYNSGDVSNASGGKFVRNSSLGNYSTYENCYSTIKSSHDDASVVEINTTNISSGELCYKLGHGTTSAPIWKQTIGTDNYPKLFGSTGVVNQVVADKSYSNLTVSDDKVEIGSLANLNQFSAEVNAGNVEMDAILTSNITDNGTFTSIGTETYKYKGTFDGDDHYVQLAINKSGTPFQGLFGCATGGAKFKNLIIKGNVNGGNNTAALVGQIGGEGESGTITINRVGCEVNVSGSYEHHGAFVGNDWGGRIKLEVENCYNIGDISGSATYTSVMGSWVDPNSSYTNVFNSGTITGNKFSHQNRGNCTNCYTTTSGAGEVSNLVQGVTSDQITSGKLCYLLNGNTQGGTDWRQTLSGSVDAHPVFFSDHKKVYQYNTSKYVNNGDKVEIGDATDLANFAALVNAGATSVDADQTADIDFSTQSAAGVMIGDKQSDNPYGGTYDGQKHNVEVTYDRSDDNAALFRFLSNATIRNLTTTGSITLSGNKKCAGGIFSGTKNDSEDTSLIENCMSWVSFNFTTDADEPIDKTYGGIGSFMHGKGTIQNCAFLGSFNAPKAKGNGGILGYANGGNNIKVKNCYVYASSIDVADNNDNKIILRNANPTNCYYVTNGNLKTQDSGASLVAVSDVTSGKLCYDLGSTNWYQDLTIDAYPVPFDTHSQVYRRGESSLYSYSNITTGSTVKIKSAKDLIDFSALVNEGNYNLNAELTNDIDMAGVTYTPIGTDAYKYEGTFDGKGCHIKNLIITGDNQKPGLFHVCGNATIRNLIMDSTCTITSNNTSGGYGGAAFVALANTDNSVEGTLTIENCGNEAMVNGTAPNKAAFVGFNWNNKGTMQIIIRNCYNRGNISGGYDNCAFVGWNDGNSYMITNCYNTGTINDTHSDGNTWGRSSGSQTVNNSYTTQPCSNIDGLTSSYSSDKVSSGELCYLLKGTEDTNAFTQAIGTDAYPTFGSATVDRGQWFGDDYIYYNIDESGNITVNELNLVDTKTAYNVPANVTAKSVTLTRTLHQLTSDGTHPRWNTFCSPVDIDKSNFSAAKELTGVTVNGDNYSMTFTDVEGDVLEAGKPYMVQVSKSKSSLTASNVAVAAAGTSTSSETFNGLTFTGNFTNGKAPMGSFIISNNVFYNVDSPVTLNAFRGYITTTSGNDVKALTFDFDDDATSLSSISSPEGKECIYNLAGQRINKMQKGINIVNGKKILF